jgi:hypothetical protein
MKLKQFGANTLSFTVGEEPEDEWEEAPTLEIFFDEKNMPVSAMLEGIPINLDVTLFNLQTHSMSLHYSAN